MTSQEILKECIQVQKGKKGIVSRGNGICETQRQEEHGSFEEKKKHEVERMAFQK